MIPCADIHKMALRERCSDFAVKAAQKCRDKLSTRAGDTVTKKTEAIRVAGSQLEQDRHVRAFLNSDEEEPFRILLPFISDGFACAYKAVHLIGEILQQKPVPPEEFLCRRRSVQVGE
jgi:hypothetical protein